MPESCYYCPWWDMKYGTEICGLVEDTSENKIDYASRPSWCPLIEVPTPHGRLIDADAYHKEIRERYESAREWYKGANTDDIKARAESALITFTECSLTLRKMPTIIEGEYGT